MFLRFLPISVAIFIANTHKKCNNRNDGMIITIFDIKNGIVYQNETEQKSIQMNNNIESILLKKLIHHKFYIIQYYVRLRC